MKYKSKGKALTKYVRISPRKARLVADLVRGLTVEEAFVQLMHSNTKASQLIKKTLNSAVANAENLDEVQRNDLFVSGIFVNAGPTMKRAKSKSKGGKVPILKRTSHLTVEVGVQGQANG